MQEIDSCHLIQRSHSVLMMHVLRQEKKVVNGEAKNVVNSGVIACHFTTETIYTYIQRYSTCNK